MPFAVEGASAYAAFNSSLIRRQDLPFRPCFKGGPPASWTSCPECGWDGDCSKVQIEVLWKELDGGEGPKEESPQFCSACGHQWEYIITWTDLPEEGEE